MTREELEYYEQEYFYQQQEKIQEEQYLEFLYEQYWLGIQGANSYQTGKD